MKEFNHIDILPIEHSRLGASSAHRWVECPNSEQGLIPRELESSEHAKRGTVAHQVAYNCLATGLQPGWYVGRIAKGDGCDGIVVTQEMADSVQVYVDHCRTLIPNIVAFNANNPDRNPLEQKIVLPHLPIEVGGTCDFHYIRGSGTLHVVDYKSGAVPQNPQLNAQLMVYAIGLIAKYRFKPDRIILTIVQPKADGVMSWECPSRVLKAFWGRVQASAEAIADGMDRYVKGDWCRWCPKKAICPLWRDSFLAMRDELDDPRALDDNVIADLLPDFARVRSYMKDVEGYAKNVLTRGGVIPGWELVPGRRKKAWAVDESVVRGYLAERSVSVTNLTPPSVLKVVPDLPREFWEWEESGTYRLAMIETEFSPEEVT